MSNMLTIYYAKMFCAVFGDSITPCDVNEIVMKIDGQHKVSEGAASYVRLSLRD